MNGIIKELRRDFMGMLSEHSIEEIADIVSDWTIRRLSGRDLTITKVIRGNEFRCYLYKSENFSEVKVRMIELFA